MEQESNKTNFLDRKAIPDLSGKNFFIPDYQRGYRWGSRQVEQLLEDLYVFFEKGKGDFYCLQPIVVKELGQDDIKHYELYSDTDDNKWYEVIDGQQRLTTICIILALFHKLRGRSKYKFTLKYKTRPKLGNIFNEFIYNRDNDEYDISLTDDQKLDIDSWHILQAAKCILKWLEKGEKRDAGIDYFTGSFLENFTHKRDLENKKSVQVIWYELRDGSDPNETFKRLNDKKVALSNAELVRAMFLSDCAKFEYDKSVIEGYPEEIQDIVKERERARKQSHIIEQWDIIEKQLRQPDFWAFVKDDGTDDSYSSRIEYLFDLITKKDASERDELYTYLEFEKMVSEKKEIDGLWGLWMKVESNYTTLLSWYDNRNYYHKIGYLIAEQGTKILIPLLELSTKQTKTAFQKRINGLIKKNIAYKVEDDIFTYSYDNDLQKPYLYRILFFYNVESTNIALTKDRFPFEQYKQKRWTLEHIHAQNSERIDRTDKKKWDIWIDENIKVLENLAIRFKEGEVHDPRPTITILKDHKSRINTNVYIFDEFVKCFDSVNVYYNQMTKDDGDSSEVHNLSNLALLSGDINSSIGNTVFEVKRQSILNQDAQGKYIPYCTRLVFLKYYNKDNKDFSVQQAFYWGKEDRENYLKNIKTVLEEVLQATNPETK